MFKKYWFWFSLIVIGYSTYDYFEHILRPDDVFKDYPVDWLLFTLGAIGSLLAIFFGLKFILDRYSKLPALLNEVLALGSWIFLYINFIGPLINHLFWPHDQLYFQFKFGPVFIILGVYFLVRLAIDFIIRRLNSKTIVAKTD
ncbi:MAG: hypothetical protein ACPGGA_02890 [Balneolaceae bacterium]